MPLYDLTCAAGHEQIDVLLPLGVRPPCPTCGLPTETLWTTSSNVIGDDIPGGYEVRHGLCNPDGSPRRYYSKSEMAKEAKKRGLVNVVEHKPAKGSDKAHNGVTSKWY